MDQDALLLACFSALTTGALPDIDQPWDMAAAAMLRTEMLKRDAIPVYVSTVDIYTTLLPAFELGTADFDHSPCSFQVPDPQSLREAGIDSTLWEEREKPMARTYVAMEVIYDTEGVMKPTALRWVNGKRFEIDRVTDVRHTANLKEKASGGAGWRYTVFINNQERYLWFMEGRWFVESMK